MTELYKALPYEALIRKRDALKGPEPAEKDMTQAQWDRRYLLGLVDDLRAALHAAHEHRREVKRQFSSVAAGGEG